MHDFVTSNIGHLKSISSLNYVDLPKIDKSIINIENSLL